METPTLRFAACLLALVTLGACSPVMISGKRNVLDFRVADSGAFFAESPSNPIAAGSRVTFDVRRTFSATGERRPENVVVATSIMSADVTPRGIIDVLEHVDSRVTVEAREVGSTELLVMSDQGADTLTVRVASVVSASVTHWSRGSFGMAAIPGHRATNLPPAASFLTGGVGRFVVHAYGESGVALTGYGRSPPLSVSPESRARIAETPPGELQFVDVLFRERGSVTLQPRAGTSLRVQVDDPTDVSALNLTAQRLRLEVGQTEPIAVYGSVGSEDRLLLGGVVGVRSATPEVCELDEASQRFGDGIYFVRARTAGECLVVSSLGELTSERKLEVVEPKRRRP